MTSAGQDLPRRTVMQQRDALVEALGASMDRETALKNLSSKDERHRKAAELALERLGPEAAGDLIARLKEEARKQHRRVTMRNWVLGGYAALVGAIFITWLLAGLFTGHWSNFPWQLFNVFSSTGGLFAVAAASQFQKSGAGLVARFGDVRGVGVLAEALEYGDFEVEREAKKALTSLLPQLKANQAELLNDQQRPCLHRAMLREGQPEEFVFAILKAFEQVGDERDLLAVRRLRDRNEHDPDRAYVSEISREARIARAAAAAILYIEQRIQASRASHTLLRPAATPGDGEAVLLRPAQGGETPIDSLLRPTDAAAEGAQAVTAQEEPGVVNIHEEF
jgi:hypothetical protein